MQEMWPWEEKLRQLPYLHKQRLAAEQPPPAKRSKKKVQREIILIHILRWFKLDLLNIFATINLAITVLFPKKLNKVGV